MRTESLFVEEDMTMRLGERELGKPAFSEVLVRVEWTGLGPADAHALSDGPALAQVVALANSLPRGLLLCSLGQPPAPGRRRQQESNRDEHYDSR